MTSFPSSSSASSSSMLPFGTPSDWATWNGVEIGERILHYLNTKMTQNNRNIRCQDDFDSMVRPLLRDDKMMDDFYIFVVPPITLAEYIKRLIQYTRISISPVNLAIALFYLERLEKSQMIDVNPFSIFRLLSTAYLIAFKATEDPPVMRNGEYSRIAGISLKEMNHLELQFLKAIQFDLGIGDDILLCHRITRVLVPPKVSPWIVFSRRQEMTEDVIPTTGSRQRMTASSNTDIANTVIVAPKVNSNSNPNLSLLDVVHRVTPDSVVDLEHALMEGESLHSKKVQNDDHVGDVTHGHELTDHDLSHEYDTGYAVGYGMVHEGNDNKSALESALEKYCNNCLDGDEEDDDDEDFYGDDVYDHNPRSSSCMLVEDVLPECGNDEGDVFDRASIDQHYGEIVYRREHMTHEFDKLEEVQQHYQREQDIQLLMQQQRQQAHQMLQQQISSSSSSSSSLHHNNPLQNSPRSSSGSNGRPPGPSFGFGYITSKQWLSTLPSSTTDTIGGMVNRVKTNLPTTDTIGGMVNRVKTNLPTTDTIGGMVNSVKTNLPITDTLGGMVNSVKTNLPTTDTLGGMVDSVNTTIINISSRGGTPNITKRERDEG